MDIVFVVLGIILILMGIAGCIFPALPGPPIAYVSLLLLKLHSNELVHPSNSVLIWYGVAVVIITIIDYFLPIWGTKKFGGTNAGKYGSIVGLIAGVFFPIFGPLTILIGPFVGAFLGEILMGNNRAMALRSGIGSFLGFVSGTFLKLAVTGMITYTFIRQLI